MKKHTIIFWITTSIIFLAEGIMPIFTSHSPMAIEGITHLGYPMYFITLLAVFKFLGGVVLIYPKFPANVKEWAYAGFGIDFISAFVSIWVVDGVGTELLPSVIAMILLVLSYNSYKKKM
jgi:hypothetical protein